MGRPAQPARSRRPREPAAGLARVAGLPGANRNHRNRPPHPRKTPGFVVVSWLQEKSRAESLLAEVPFCCRDS